MAVQDPIQTQDQIHQATVSNIATNLKQVGHDVSTASVTPVTATTPITRSPHMEAIGAQVIGEDIKHVVGSTVGDLTMGVQKTRITPSKRFLGKLLDRLSRKK
jgi:hypothetical protein